MARIICGVDLASTTLDARIGSDGPFQRFAADPDGIAALSAFCKANKVDLVAMEATGGYEKKPFSLLWAHGLPCAILNPRQVRRFAEAMGILEKTDRIDAGVIARFAEVRRIKPQPPARPVQEQLAAQVTRLRQLTSLRTAQINQRRLVTDPEALASIDEIMAVTNRQIRAFEQRIASLIEADPLWAALDRTFRSIKGVAGRTVACLMATLPEIGTFSGKAVAKLAGLAPIANDSGKSSGKRPVRGGRREVRAILYIVAGLVRKYDPDFADFHQRLSKAGKPKKVIRIALAHKLLIRLNAKARDARLELAQAT